MSNPLLLGPGTAIRDTYTIDGHIASGAFADVYRVRHRYMGMQAMKVLRDGRTEDERVQGLYEAFRLAKVAHPSIVRVYDGNCLEREHGGFPYVTMELVEEGTLTDLERATGALYVQDLLDACEQLAAALEHAHTQDPPIVHRDIKPSNVLLARRSDGRLSVRLADFGLAVPISKELGFVSAHGTLIYRSPESLGGMEMPSSDVYSWGLTMYEAATGVNPFTQQLREVGSERALELMAALKGAQKSDIDVPSYYRHAIHPVIDALIMRCLCVDHRLRIPDGAVLHRATRAARDAVEGNPSPAAPVRRALYMCRNPERTDEAISLLSRALKSEREGAPSYIPWIAYLRSERERMRGHSS